MASKTYTSLTGEMKQQNAKHLVQAYATDEKYKQNMDIQAPCLCPITLLIKKTPLSYFALQQGFPHSFKC